MNRSQRVLARVLIALVATQSACALTAGSDGETPSPAPTETAGAPSEATRTVEPTPKVPSSETPVATDSPAVATATATAEPAAGPACELAFVREGQLVCRLNDARELQMANVDGGSVQRVAISSDGQMLAYIIGAPDNPSDLFAISLEAALAGERAPTLLANDTNLTGGQPDDFVSAANIAFVFGQEVVVFDTAFVPAGGIQGPGEYVNNDLWRVNADGSGLTQILPAGQGGRFAVSPAGPQVAISSPTAISVVDLETGAQTVALEYDPIVTYSEYSLRPVLNWRPDGTEFTVVVPSPDPLAEDTNATLHLISVDGVEQPLGLVPGNFVFSDVIALAPDGSRIAVGRRDENSQVNAIRVSASGGGASADEIILAEVQWLQWSPDGEQLLIVHRNVIDNGTLFSTRDGSLRSLDLPVRDAVWRGPDLYYLVENGDGTFDVNALRGGVVEVLQTAIDTALWAVR